MNERRTDFFFGFHAFAFVLKLATDCDDASFVRSCCLFSFAILTAQLQRSHAPPVHR